MGTGQNYIVQLQGRLGPRAACGVRRAVAGLRVCSKGSVTVPRNFIHTIASGVAVSEGEDGNETLAATLLSK